MEFLAEESKSGYFEVFKNESGQRLVVIEGLDPEKVHEPGVLERHATQHYGVIETGYWLLLVGVISYLIYTHILFPLLRRKSSQ